jgi:hypothetical protein
MSCGSSPRSLHDQTSYIAADMCALAAYTRLQPPALPGVSFSLRAPRQLPDLGDGVRSVATHPPAAPAFIHMNGEQVVIVRTMRPVSEVAEQSVGDCVRQVGGDLHNSARVVARQLEAAVGAEVPARAFPDVGPSTLGGSAELTSSSSLRSRQSSLIVGAWATVRERSCCTSARARVAPSQPGPRSSRCSSPNNASLPAPCPTRTYPPRTTLSRLSWPGAAPPG